MVGTGLRVDEALNLKWDDVTMMDRFKDQNAVVKNFGNDFLTELERYYLIINMLKRLMKEKLMARVVLILLIRI